MAHFLIGGVVGGFILATILTITHSMKLPLIVGLVFYFIIMSLGLAFSVWTK